MPGTRVDVPQAGGVIWCENVVQNTTLWNDWLTYYKARVRLEKQCDDVNLYASGASINIIITKDVLNRKELH